VDRETLNRIIELEGEDSPIPLMARRGLLYMAPISKKKQEQESNVTQDMLLMFEAGSQEENMSQEMLSLIINKLDTLSAQVAGIEAKLSAASSFSPAKGPYKKGGGAKGTGMQSITTKIEKVFVDKKPGQDWTKYSVLYDGGQRITTLKDHIGKAALSCEGKAAVLTIGVNQKGYPELFDAQPSDEVPF
jgi:hypothetical protein